MGVEHGETLGHFFLPDPDVVQGLVNRDVPEDPLDGRTGTPAW
jgi:hypothetical protein